MTRCGWLAVAAFAAATLAAGCSAGGASSVPTVTTTTTLPPVTSPAARAGTSPTAPADASSVVHDCIGRPVVLPDSFARVPERGGRPRQDLCD